MRVLRPRAFCGSARTSWTTFYKTLVKALRFRKSFQA
jgi:hypothetical protein